MKENKINRMKKSKNIKKNPKILKKLKKNPKNPEIFKKSKKSEKSENIRKNPKKSKQIWGFKILTPYLGVNNPSGWT